MTVQIRYPFAARLLLYSLAITGMLYSTAQVLKAGEYPYCCNTDQQCVYPAHPTWSKCCTACPRETACSETWANWCEVPTEDGHCPPCSPIGG